MGKWFAQGVTSCKNQGFSSQRGVGSEDAAMASVRFSDPQREVASEDVVMAFVYCFYNPRRELGPENMWWLLCASFLSLPLNIFKFVCLFILYAGCCFPSLFSSQPLFPSSVYCRRKVQVSHEYQQSMTHQVAVRLNISTKFKTEQGDAGWRVGSLNSVKK